MPNARTIHPTIDGSNIGKILIGDELQERLNLLGHTARQNHEALTEANRVLGEKQREIIEFARKAGEALLEVKRRLGHKTKWSKWRSENLIKPKIMSKETTVIYMRIAREWNDSAVRDALLDDSTIPSIRKINGIIQKITQERVPQKTRKTKRPSEQVDKEKIAGIKKRFSWILTHLDEYEIDILHDDHVAFEIEEYIRNLTRTYVGVFIGDTYPDQPCEPMPPGIRPETHRLYQEEFHILP